MQHTSLQLKKSRKDKLISVIVANYNGEKYLKKCLSSVILSLYKNIEIVIIDDGSTDTSIKIIKEYQKKDKRIILIKNHKNIGAAASRNRAIKFSKGELFIFLDNDTEVDKKWIDEIMDEFKLDTTVGAVQSVLLDYQKRKLIQNAGVQLWAETGWGLPFFQWKNYEVVYDKLPSEIVAISAALAVKKEAFQVTRGFDEKESVVTEDLDFSWRLWVSGYKIRLAKKSKVYHWTKGVEMRKNMKHTKKTIYFHLTKNSLSSILKNYEALNAFRYILYCTVISIVRGALVFIRRHENEALIGSFQALLWVILNIFYIYKQRVFIQKNRRVDDSFLFNTILIQKNPLFIYKHYFKQTNLL